MGISIVEVGEKLWKQKLDGGKAKAIYTRGLEGVPGPSRDSVSMLRPKPGFDDLEFRADVRRDQPRYIIATDSEKKTGMSSVFMAWDVKLGIPVVLKFVEPGLHLMPGFYHSLEMEAKTEDRIYGLTGGAVPIIYDLIYTSDSKMAIVMEYLGDDQWQLLSDRVESEKLSFDEVIDIMEKLAKVVDILAENGLFHADLKLSNIFISRGGGSRQIKLIDFGISNWAFDKYGSKEVGAGCPDFMSPRRSKTNEVDMASEKYAMAVMIIRMLSGKSEGKNELILSDLLESRILGDKAMLVLRSVLGEDERYMEESASSFICRLLEAQGKEPKKAARS